ncbi:MAG TPA: DUF4234 domain-containing protein [Candidatus Saccharimonadales bacterium]|nr:DUF4234 domain-containing protein [Candidatus Saccharimonadales bacterium]
MKKRNPIVVFLLSFITLFIYSWYWQVKTKGEMNKLGEKIPTAFIWLIPIVGSIWWTWKYSEGVEHVTQGKMSGVLAFVVLWLLGPIGNAIVQDSFNKVDGVVAVADTSVATQPVANVNAQPAVTPPAPTQPDQPQDSPALPPQPPVEPPTSTSTPVVG